MSGACWRAMWWGAGAAAIWLAVAAAPAQQAATTTRPVTTPATAEAGDYGPDVVVLQELVALYEPVPFDHRSHARMAQMWDGCVTCHHLNPEPATQPSTQPAAIQAIAQTQDNAAAIPACKSCHPVAVQSANLHRPNLKGAYHRQCLSCHQEWMHGNACVVCHKPREGSATQPHPPTRDDIVGRMHPPIPEPDTKLYKTRFTPADGGNVLFRHKEHTAGFGLKCVSCHRHDNCAHCHDPQADTAAQKPVKPGKTWQASHGPCMGCHQQARCQHCHYKDGQSPPKSFDHRRTGQALDAAHAKLSCGQCHGGLRLEAPTTCGNAACHKPTQPIAYPAQRPGPVVATQPATRPSTQPARSAQTRPTATQPATRPTIVRIRR